jgi:hypothetical protein
MTRVFFALLIFTGQLVYSQQYESFNAENLNYIIPPSQPSIILKTNPGTILIGPIIFTSEYRLAAEFPVKLHNGVQVAVSYLGENIFLKLLNKDTTLYGIKTKGVPYVVSGFRIQFSYKRYIFERFFGNAPYGVYVGLHYSFSRAKLTLEYLNLYNEYLFAVYENYDIIGGYQFHFLNKLAVYVFGGLGYKKNFYGVYDKGKVQNLNAEGFFIDMPLKIVLGFNAGFEF